MQKIVVGRADIVREKVIGGTLSGQNCVCLVGTAGKRTMGDAGAAGLGDTTGIRVVLRALLVA